MPGVARGMSRNRDFFPGPVLLKFFYCFSLESHTETKWNDNDTTITVTGKEEREGIKYLRTPIL